MMLKPKKLCEQYSEIAIGAQNPFYLRKAKVAQPTLYDGNEIINPDHDPTNVPSSEEDLELAELARQKMHEKMNDPVCVEKRIKYIPPNYSKENFLATFTPQTQLTPEQVFWSIDLEKRKAEELKANTPPLPVLPPATVLLPLGDQWPLTRNTPPKVLATKQWKPTGRLLPLGRQCLLVRSTALKSDCMPADLQETIAPVAYNLACTNQPDPNCNWGSNVSGTDNQEKDEKQSQNDKTGLGMEKL
ncbi:hypothetical protein Tco_0420448 [Tanacetum coccineum]